MHLYLRLLHYYKKYWKAILIAMICVLLYSASNFYFMWAIRDIVKAFKKENMELFHNWMLDGFLLLIIFCLANYGQKYWMEKATKRALMDIRISIFRNLQMLSLDFFGKWRVGDLISRSTNDTNMVGMTITSLVSGMLPGLFSVIGIIGGLFYLYPKYALISFILIPVYAYFVNKISKWLRLLTKSSQERLSDMLVILQESLSNIHLVKAFAQERHEIKRYTTSNAERYRYDIQKIRIDASKTPIMDFLGFFILIILAWIGGREVIAGNMPGENLAAFFTGFGLLASNIKKIGDPYVSLQQSFAAAERFFELLDVNPSIQEPKNSIKLHDLRGEVVFEDVSFHYRDDENVLKDINLRVAPGEIIALVGSSGAGKTTLVNLIPRFYDPQQGRVIIDGVDLTKLSLSSYRNNIGIVPQDAMFFNDSIKENIKYGKMRATDEQVIEACKSANAHQFITLFPEGYDTLVGDRGVRLSGGQKQRISIARALLRDPRILILDEATSALDTESERLVQEALNHLMRNRTTFVIAHRLSTITNAHKIVVIDKGRITEVGSHTELLAQSGVYHKLYNLQFNT